jgi:hypothetical protein
MLVNMISRHPAGSSLGACSTSAPVVVKSRSAWIGGGERSWGGSVRDVRWPTDDRLARLSVARLTSWRRLAPRRRPKQITQRRGSIDLGRSVSVFV